MEPRQDVETRLVSANIARRLMWFTLPLDVIWKHEMGERYWTFLRLIAHTFVTQFAAFFLMFLAFPSWLAAPPSQGWRVALALYGFIALVWIFGLANLREIRMRRKAGIQWHTHYWGTPRFFPDKPIVRCLVIPAGSGLIACCIYLLFPPLGVYLFLMAAAQFVDAADTYHARKVEKLDRNDREIHMKIKAAEVENSYRGPVDVVRIAAPAPKTRIPEQEAAFQSRWKSVFKYPDGKI